MSKVGTESEKTFRHKMQSGFFELYMFGNGLDVGGKGYNNAEAILPEATLVDLDYPNYNGTILPFDDNSQNYVYSSHVLEHITDYKASIKEWLRVTKPGGYIITVVPHRDLYEKKEFPPSRFNGDHKRFYTPASLLKEFEDSLPINSFRVRHMRDNDIGHDYSDPQEVHGKWLYEIELVIQKL